MRGSLSVVVPAYNEELRITPTLEKIGAYLTERFSKFEVIVVDDGSTDRTALIVDEFRSKLDNVRLISYKENAGKGSAVRKGVLASKYELLLTCDADLSTPIQELEKLMPYIENGYDIAIGSRGLEESNIVVRQPWYREGMGKVFNNFVSVLVIGNIKDTQCGFKLFRGEVSRKLFTKSLIRGFAFDVEILFLAKEAGYKIQEVPVQWLNSPNSKVRLVFDPMKMFLELLKIRAFFFAGKYRNSAKEQSRSSLSGP